MNAATAIMKAFEELGVETRDYSGRGMFGAKCVGTVVESHSEAYGVIAKVAIQTSTYHQNEQVTQDVVSILSSARTDGMGRSLILYFEDLEG